MKTLNDKEFYKKYNTRVMTKMSTPLISKAENIILPKGTAIHYIPEGSTELGVDLSHCMMRNIGDRVLSYHVVDLKVVQGTVKPVRENTDKLIRQYRKRYRMMQNVKDVDASNHRIATPMVVDYSLLPRLSRYSVSNLNALYEWSNLRATMWDTLSLLGDERTHFIRLKLPKYLPSKNDLNKYVEKFTVTGLTSFKEPSTFDILEIWSILHPDVTSVVDTFSPELLNKINIVFIESGQVIIIRLLDLIGWAKEDSVKTMSTFYKMLDNLMSSRVVDTKEVIRKDNSDIDAGLVDVIEHEIISRGQLGNLSGAEQKSFRKASEGYKTIPNPHGDGTIEDLLTVTERDLSVNHQPVLNDSPTILDKSMLESSIKDFDNKYVRELLNKDIAAMIMSLQKAGVVVKSIKTVPHSNVVGKSVEYRVQVQPVGGKVSTIKFTLPLVDPDGIYINNGVKSRMSKQRGELPIAKTKPNMVGLTSYYGKIFITRNENVSVNFSRWIRKQIENRYAEKDSNITTVIFGLNNYLDLSLPREFTATGESISRLELGKTVFNFNYKGREKFFKPEELKIVEKHGLTICGKTNGLLMGMDSAGVVYQIEQGATTAMGTIPMIIGGIGHGPIEYSEITVYSKHIPMIIALCYQMGLENCFDYLGLHYDEIPPNARHPQGDNPNYYKLKFKDTAYMIDCTDPEIKLLIGGFNAIRKITTTYKSTDFNRKQVYVPVLSSMGITNQHLRELSLIFDMFVDPITLSILKERKEPETFRGLIMHANKLLINDEVSQHQPARFKGYERFAGMLYIELIRGVRGYRGRQNMPDAKIDINPRAVHLDILRDETTELVEDSTPIKEIRERETVTFAGAGGRSARSMVKDARGYSEHDMGVISGSSPDSQKVGIRTYTTPDPNFTNLRGITSMHDSAVDGPAKMVSTTTLLSPASNMDDAKRENFIGIQHDSAVPSDGNSVQPYRTGYEQVIGNRCGSLYSRPAHENGKVTSMSDQTMEVTYKSGIKETIDLGAKYGVVAGTVTGHTLVTPMRKGQTFKMNDILAYNPDYFEPTLLNPGNVSFKTGVVTTVAFLENSDTIEDGCTLSTAVAKQLRSKSFYVRNIIIDFDQVIHNLVKVGDELDTEAILCTLEDSVTAELSAKGGDSVGALSRITANNPKSKHDGIVNKVEVLYFGATEDMSESLKKIVSADNRRRKNDSIRLKDDNAHTGEIDANLQVEGSKIVKGKAVIKVYIDGAISVGTGDKLVLGNQLKSTSSRVVTEPIVTKSGTEVNVLFGYQSVADRVIGSAEKTGAMNALLTELSKQTAKLYKGN